jgi:transcriptional regulator with XRE-family HTH domain
MTVGERIRLRRKELNISAEAIADAINCSPATIYRYENGGIEKVPSDVLCDIAEFLHTSAPWFMGWSDNPDLPAITEEEREIKKEAVEALKNQYLIDKLNKLTPENRIRFDAFLDGLLAGQEKPES